MKKLTPFLKGYYEMGKTLDIYSLSDPSTKRKRKKKSKVDDDDIVDEKREKKAKKKKKEARKSWVEKADKIKKKKKAKDELKSIEKTRKENKRKSKEKVKELEEKLQQTNSLNALFGKDSLDIQDLLENRENDNAITLARKAMLQMSLDLIPLAEQDYRDRRTDRAVYALNALLSQVRELIADIQADSDRTEVINRIIVNTLQPNILLLGNQLVGTTFELRRRLEEHIEKGSRKAVKQILEDTSKDLGAFAQGLFNDLKDKITKELSET